MSDQPRTSSSNLTDKLAILGVLGKYILFLMVIVIIGDILV